jgi:hypothetical protein
MNMNKLSASIAWLSLSAAAALAQAGPLGNAAAYVDEVKTETKKEQALADSAAPETKPRTFSSLAEAPMHPPYYSDDGVRWSQGDAEAAMNAHAAVLEKVGYTIVSKRATKDRFLDLYEFVVQYADARPDPASDNASKIKPRTAEASTEAPFDPPYYVDYGVSSDPDDAKAKMAAHVADLKKVGYDVADARVYQREGHEATENGNPTRGTWYYHYVVRYLDNRPIDLWRTPYTPQEGRYFGTTPEGGAFVTPDQAFKDMNAYVESRKKEGYTSVKALVYQGEGGAPFYYYYLAEFSR